MKFCNTIKGFFEKENTPLEKGLLVAVAFFIGLVVGIYLSPKKNRVFGSYNGSNSGNNCGSSCDLADEVEEDDYEEDFEELKF